MTLVQSTRALGFLSVSRLFRKGVADIDTNRATPSFFLVHHQLDEAIMRSVIATIRYSDNDQIRFAPLVLLLQDGPFELVLRYVRLGFDDVIALPERREMVANRLRGQLDQEVVYFETPSYLGPDRRRMERPAEAQDERRTGHHAHTRYTLVRSADKGIRVVRTEVVGQVAKGPFARPAPTNPTGGDRHHHA